MYRVVRSPVLTKALPCAFVVVLLGCDAVVSLDPVISDSDAVQAPEILGDWTANDTVIYRVTADASKPSDYVMRFTGPGVAEEPALGDVVLALRATRIGERLLLEVTLSEDDSLIGRVKRTYGSLLQPAYMHAVIVATGDTLRAVPFDVSAVRHAIASGACPAARGRALRGSSDVASRDVVLGGAPGELRMLVTCLLDRPGVLADSEALHRPRLRAPHGQPRRDPGDVPGDGLFARPRTPLR